MSEIQYLALVISVRFAVLDDFLETREAGSHSDLPFPFFSAFLCLLDSVLHAQRSVLLARKSRVPFVIV